MLRVDHEADQPVGGSVDTAGPQSNGNRGEVSQDSTLLNEKIRRKLFTGVDDVLCRILGSCVRHALWRRTGIPEIPKELRQGIQILRFEPCDERRPLGGIYHVIPRSASVRFNASTLVSVSASSV